jgi:hypothetical protein
MVPVRIHVVEVITIYMTSHIYFKNIVGSEHIQFINEPYMSKMQKLNFQ